MEDGCTYQYLAHRGISRRTFEHYKVFTKVDANGKPLKVDFPYGSHHIIRGFDEKRDMVTTGDSSDVRLFGQDYFPPGCNESITITEGGYDALAAYEMLGTPAVSIKSAQSARKECAAQIEYLNSFNKIYLCFDSDKPGQDATKDVAMLFDQNKLRIVKMGAYKDANEMLEQGQQAKFRTCWNNARAYMPKEIIASWDELTRALEEKEAAVIGSYPFKTLNEMAYQIRLGEFILFTAQEKVGKTEVIRAIEHHLLCTTDHNMGIIHLEEQERRSLQGLAGLHLGLPAHLPDAGVSNKDVMQCIKEMTKRDGRLHFYSHFGSDNPDVILDMIRYMVTVRGCKFIFLDHITMLVTGFEDEGERKKLDYLSTRLAMMTRELGFTLFCVSHVNDDGKTRGSRNIGKVADLLIHLDRDIEAENFTERNKTRLIIRGNRYAGQSGPAGVLNFDPKTYSLKELTEKDLKLEEANPGF